MSTFSSTAPVSLAPTALAGDEPKTAADGSWMAPPPKRRGVRVSRLILAVKVVLAIGLLVWLVRSGGLDFRRLLEVRPCGELAVLLALLFGSLALPALRWWWLLKIQGVREPFARVLVLTWVGYFTALVLPGAASGDIVKGYFILHRQAHLKARALSTVLLDRLLGIYNLLILGMLAIGWLYIRGETSPRVMAMGGVTILLLVGLSLGAGMFAFEPVRRNVLRVLPAPWREAWLESIDLYVHNKAGLAVCCLLSFASTAMFVSSFAVAGAVLGRTVPLGATFLAGPLVVLANCLPLSPGGVGVAEAAADGLFCGFGVQGGAELMVLVRVCLAGLALPGVFGLFWASSRCLPAQLSETSKRGVQP